MKIAVLGGSFDPPHQGHAIIAERLIKLFNFGQVWLMPCFKHPFNKKLTSPKHRLAMTKFLRSKNIKVSDLEIKRKKISYTIDTLNSLKKMSPKNQFFWVAGSDQMKSFKKWKKWEEILEKFKLIIIPRNGAKTTNLFTNAIILDREKFSPIRISSSTIRERIKKGKKIDKMVPKEVESYIIQHKLYL